MGLQNANPRSIALANDQIRLVQASILGSILVNLLLILGSALLANRLSNQKPVLNSAETQLLACLLFVSVFVILMPVCSCVPHFQISQLTEPDGF